MKEKSHSGPVKAATMKNQKSRESYVLDLYIEMLLSEIQLHSEKEKLLKKIDKALDDYNRETFNQLAKEYKELIRRFGT
ncbi:IDEAL domain-containing protein [Bacillus massilinigeriensis]|uniref:IDEAL domain-containing protein n=1 Tax=Bacillus massilionigeriensis TaxID=1805475 RepID=UPI00096B56B9|nr:IDEAL domain-containing protein [Bacillus massilionigeriensis]